MVTNGAIPDSQLVLGIQGWAKLWPSTAAKFSRFEAELLAVTGIRPIITRNDQGLTDIGAYRTYAQQVRAKQLLGTKAAAPGYSNHGLGRAFDVYNISRYNQATIDRVALKNGLVRDGLVNSRAESWHYHDADGIMPAGGGFTPIPIEKEIDTSMLNFAFTPEGNGYVITEDGGAEPLTSSEWAAFQALRAAQATPDGATRVTMPQMVTISECLRRISNATALRTIAPLVVPVTPPVIDLDALATKIAAKLPATSGATKQDVLDAIASIRFPAVPTKGMIELS